jgi:hypothetical protein
VFSTAVIVVLVAATAVAFALTERVKLERSPIYKTSVDRVFSPACGARCATRVARIDFRLRKRERLTIWVEHDGRRTTIVPGRTYPAGRVSLVFTGVGSSGATLPDGIYRPVVHLGFSHRTIALPNEIRIDTKPPVAVVHHPQHAVISPDGDGRKDSFRTTYRVSEPARAILRVDRQDVVVTYRRPLRGTLTWNGRIDGHPARPGNHLLEISARDPAGNESKPFPFAIVQVRFVALGRKRVVVRPGARFAIRVSADASRVTWLLHGRTGLARPGTLRIRAPGSPGVYRLYVTAAGHAAKATVVVA